MALEVVRSLDNVRTLRPDITADMIGCVLAIGYNPDYPDIAFDYSPRQNHGVMEGATWVLENGLWVMSFDGISNYVNCGNSSTLNPSAAITIEVVANLESLVADYVSLVTRAPNAEYRLLVDPSEKASIGFNIGGWKVVTAVNALTVGQWYHLVGTADGANVNLYINGVAETPTAAVGAINTDVDNTIIGATGDAGDSRWWPGLIGGVKIYNRALSIAEIRAHSRGARFADIRELAPVR